MAWSSKASLGGDQRSTVHIDCDSSLSRRCLGRGPGPGLLLLGLLLALALALAGCGKGQVSTPQGRPPAKKPAGTKPYTVFGQTYYPITDVEGYEQEGVASWYGPNFHGKKTSNGEIYNMEAMTAAHKILPFETYVEINNLDNGRKIVVRINDRGPFVKDRIVDLSKAAARELGVLAHGTAHVKLTALGFRTPGTGVAGRPAEYHAPASYRVGVFTVQVGAFANESNAWRLAAKLRTVYPEVVVVAMDRGDMLLHRVRVGKVQTLSEAEKLQTQLRNQGFGDAFAVAW
ncbi:MAG: septal ring lytic transglycosylase RlpA family protein [Deltaproteobacteria bacterium]|nr:septal ring lytic transglycosylase RlpA family protein [Deltaproteobacteria bacterium]